jgi:hypothetical protein
MRRADSYRPRVSSLRSALSTAGALISLTGISRNVGYARSKNHLVLERVLAARPSLSIRPTYSSAIPSNVVAKRSCFSCCFARPAVHPLEEQMLHVIAGSARRGKRDQRIGSDREKLPPAGVAIGEAPQPRAVGRDPELESATIGQLLELFRRPGRSAFHVGERYQSKPPRWSRSQHREPADTNPVPTMVFVGRLWTSCADVRRCLL